MATVKKNTYEDKLERVIRETFSDFTQYLPTIQDKKLFERRMTDYIKIIIKRMTEENNDNGNARADDTSK